MQTPEYISEEHDRAKRMQTAKSMDLSHGSVQYLKGVRAALNWVIGSDKESNTSVSRPTLGLDRRDYTVKNQRTHDRREGQEQP